MNAKVVMDESVGTVVNQTFHTTTTTTTGPTTEITTNSIKSGIKIIETPKGRKFVSRPLQFDPVYGAGHYNKYHRYQQGTLINDDDRKYQQYKKNTGSNHYSNNSLPQRSSLQQQPLSTLKKNKIIGGGDPMTNNNNQSSKQFHHQPKVIRELLQANQERRVTNTHNSSIGVSGLNRDHHTYSQNETSSSSSSLPFALQQLLSKQKTSKSNTTFHPSSSPSPLPVSSSSSSSTTAAATTTTPSTYNVSIKDLLDSTLGGGGGKPGTVTASTAKTNPSLHTMLNEILSQPKSSTTAPPSSKISVIPQPVVTIPCSNNNNTSKALPTKNLQSSNLQNNGGIQWLFDAAKREKQQHPVNVLPKSSSLRHNVAISIPPFAPNSNTTTHPKLLGEPVFPVTNVTMSSNNNLSTTKKKSVSNKNTLDNTNTKTTVAPVEALLTAAATTCKNQQESTTTVGTSSSPALRKLTTAATTSVSSFPYAKTSSLWEFNLSEDKIDEEFLFKRDELQRRRNSRYLARTKRLHDLHIVIPISVPNGKIVVDDCLGANYYQFNSNKYVGAHILFGKGVATATSEGQQKKTNGTALMHKGDSQQALNDKTTNFSEMGKSTDNDMDKYETTLQKMANSITTDEETHEIPQNTISEEVTATSILEAHSKGVKVSSVESIGEGDSELKNMNPACDVWASFLHIRLGTIYNLNEEQIVHVVERFRNAFDRDMCYFYVPISVDCRGIYPSTDDLISQRAGRSQHLLRDAKQGGNRSAAERYETRGTPRTENDIKRLRMLKRYLKRFALGLVHDLRFNRSPVNSDVPLPCIELHDNCRTSTLINGSLKIVVREWSRLDDPEIFKKVWNGKLASSIPHHGLADEVWAKILEHKDIPSARALLGEIRLEHNHLRMVDPRWPDELILGRRIADYYPHLETPVSDGSPARFLFCTRIRKPKVVYSYIGEHDDPQQAALASRLGPLFKVHLERYPLAGLTSERRHTESIGLVGSDDVSLKDDIKNEGNKPEPKLSLDNTVPNVSEQDNQKDFSEIYETNVLNASTTFETTATKDFSDLPKPLQQLFGEVTKAERFIADKSLIQEGAVNKKIPFSTSDRNLESKVDVRQISPKHPKFFP